jgi:hypothetical protein
MKWFTLLLCLFIFACDQDEEPQIEELTLEYLAIVSADGGWYGYGLKWNQNLTIDGQERTLIQVANLKLTTEDDKPIKYEFQRLTDGIFKYHDCRPEITYKWKAK